MATAARDAERVRSVMAARHSTSQRFFASSAAQWDKLRGELFGTRTELLALLGLLDARWTVGDLGCGTGQLAEAMAPFVKRVDRRRRIAGDAARVARPPGVAAERRGARRDARIAPDREPASSTSRSSRWCFIT